MDGRLSLFNNTKRVINLKVPEVQHVDLYNENVEYVDEESALPYSSSSAILNGDRLQVLSYRSAARAM